MALRNPPASLTPPPRLAELTKDQAPQDAIAWQTYDIELVTPMYGGGVAAGEVDKDYPIRPTAIRGQLRFWWRFLAKHKYGMTPEQIRDEEALLWGGFYVEKEGKDRGKKKPKASKIMVRVEQPKQRLIEAWAHYDYNHKEKKYKSLPTPRPWANAPYALFPAQGKAPDKIGAENPADLLKATQWRLSIRLIPQGIEEELAEEQTRRINETLRWWATFGGVGARTRRGLGAVRIQDEKLPAISPQEVQQVAGCQFALMPQKFDSASDAWQKAISRFKAFRMGEGYSAANQALFKKARTAEKHLAESVLTGQRSKSVHQSQFPRARFGLPILFQFGKGDNTQSVALIAVTPDKTAEEPANKALDRMSSPLILRPYFEQASGKWRAAALLLPCPLTPEDSLLVTESINTKETPPPLEGITSGLGPVDLPSEFLKFFAGTN